MPVNPIVSAIVSNIIEAIVNAPPAGPPMPQSFVEVPGYMRTLPAEAKMGEMLPPQQNQVMIDGVPLRMSPAAQIRTAQNTIVPAAMVTHPTVVRYTLDFTGAVHRVWILSPVEAAQLYPR